MVTELAFDPDAATGGAPDDDTSPADTAAFDLQWRRCAGIDPDALHDVPSERLEQELRGLAGQLAAATCAFLVLVGEYDAREEWREWETLSCAHWLNWRCGVGMVAAREQVRVARRLRALPRLREEFAAGRLSYSKVRAISRVSDPAVVDHLIRIAATATAAQVESMVSVVRREERRTAEHDDPGEGSKGSDEDQGLADAARVAGWLRSLTWDVDESGDLVVHARIPAGVAAESFVAAVEARTVRRPADDEDLEPLECRHLDAMLDLVADATAAGVGSLSAQPEVVVHHHLEPVPLPLDERPDPDPDPDPDPGPVAARRRVDRGSRPAGISRAVEGANPTRPPAGDWWDWTTAAGWRLSSTAFETLSCDAAVRALAEVEPPEGAASARPLHGDFGSPLRRVPTPALRRFVFDRDGGVCRFPGCDRRSRLQVHHVVWWSRGGPTVAENLVLVCAHHHAAVHERSWVMTGTADALTILRPDGTPVDPAAPRTSGSIAEFWAAFDRHGPDVALDGAGGTWLGEPIDWDCFSAAVLGHLEQPPDLDGESVPPRN